MRIDLGSQFSEKYIFLVCLIGSSLLFSACTFVEDRSHEDVLIVDAAESKVDTNKNTEPSKPNPVRIQEYYVQANDTLGTIAAKTMGSQDLYLRLASFNKIDVKKPLHIGQRLLIPPRNYQPSQRQVTISPLKRPNNIATNEPDYSEMNKLIADNKFNQAIDWAISQPALNNLPNLQEILVSATTSQVMIERSKQNYAEALFLINGLLDNHRFAVRPKNDLITLRSELLSEQAAFQAQQKLKANNYSEAYDDLLIAYKANSTYITQIDSFIGSRSQVTEHMHQEALKLYHNQQLDKALSIWDKILAIKPQDDLALVYKDRVIHLKKKLKDL